MSAHDFWEDPEKARNVSREVALLKQNTTSWESLHSRVEDLHVCAELAGQDEELSREFDQSYGEVAREIEAMELATLLSGEHDGQSAILTVHAGAGGTESQDWAEMLLRMYLRWSENHRYKAQIVDISPGEEAGIKGATVVIEGLNAYGYLKAERGVHRLVRISPFDAAHRRHTSFASVEVIPQIEEDAKVELREDDLRIETYRASGAGGQHVNKTDSAVRIIHIPTGTIVQCQNERSQHSNKVTALRILKARLLERERVEQRKRMEEIRGEQKEIAWGSQIRSYVFHPYSLIKDLRTGAETGNVQAVMDGEIDQFIRTFLESSKGSGKMTG